MMATPAAVRVWESELALYRRVWKSNVLGSFVQPMLYLLGMGIGVGSLVDERAGSAAQLGDVSYVAFFAPSILAVTTMMICAQDSLWPVMDGFMWSNHYRAISATPLRPADIVSGLTLWHATRSAIAATGVAAALLLLDDTRTWGLIPAVAFAVLNGLAFTLPIAAWSSTRTSDISFPAIIRFGIIPMFLFAGAFYPVDQLPAWLRPLAYVTPIYHGVELCRGAVLGTLGALDSLGHLAALGAFVVGGSLMCRRSFHRRLAT